MLTPKGILNTLWLVWFLSWMVAAGWTGPTRVRQSIVERLVHTLLISVGVALLFGLAHGLGPLMRPLYPHVPAMAWGSVTGVAVGLAWTWWARLHLGRMWSARVTLKEDHALVRTGPYRLTRHPIYTGVLLAVAATAVEAGTWAAVCGCLLCTTGFVMKSRQEERLLSTTLGAEYAAYRAAVPALIPKPW